MKSQLPYKINLKKLITLLREKTNTKKTQRPWLESMSLVHTDRDALGSLHTSS